VNTINRVRSALDKKWREISVRVACPVYFYVISSINKGWGVVVPEIFGVLKHARARGYHVCFIATEGSHIETIRLFEIGVRIDVLDREKFIVSSGIESHSSILAQPAWNNRQLLTYLAEDLDIGAILRNTPEYHWPFSDLLRVMVHSTEYVHPEFAMDRAQYSAFEKITLHGLIAGSSPMRLTLNNINLAKHFLRVDGSPRYVLSVRQAPPSHGVDRNTSPEDLDQILRILSNFTSKIDLVGTRPTGELCNVIRRHSSHVRVLDHTYDAYEAYAPREDDMVSAQKHLVQSYLLSTANIMFMPQNGMVVIPSACGLMHGVYGSSSIFHPWQRHSLVIPRRFRFAAHKSAVKAFIYGLASKGDTGWVHDRISCSDGVVRAGVENLLKHYISDSPRTIYDDTVFMPGLVQAVRRLLPYSPQIKHHFDLVDYGSHLIQDAEGLPIRY